MAIEKDEDFKKLRKEKKLEIQNNNLQKLINCFSLYLNQQYSWDTIQTFSIISPEHSVSWTHWSQF